MEECVICLEIMKTDIILLNCLHKFHTLCILKYKNSYNCSLCPICRQDAIFMTRCNLRENKDGSVSYMARKNTCCEIM